MSVDKYPSIFSRQMATIVYIFLRQMASIDYIDHFRYIKIQPNTIDFSTRLWGINPTNSVVIPQSLVLRYIVLG